MSNEKTPQQFFKPGAVVYFQKAHRRPTQKADAMRTPTGAYAFGLLLGVAPPHAPEPTEEVIFAIAANFGMVTIDSIIELMGEEVANQYLAKLKKKYEGINNPPPPPSAPPKSAILGADGRPLEMQ